MFGVFVLTICVTLCVIIWTGATFIYKHGSTMQALAIIATILCIVSTAILSQTAQTKLVWINFTAGAQKGIWLVIDNSGGKTLRHWVLYEGYVDGCKETDGWEFFAESCSPCKVGGDSFVGKISKEQLINDDYKRQFNIPEDQEALH